ncbi:MAG TPA: hypothetical protein VMD47_03510 [Candidatus Acidoferrales bacterium]|nr:hypothetical protein [Candidatus Acidoferrales bacterium]
MQRNSIVAEIFGYLVCLLAVAVFFISIAGIVNSAFAVVNPHAGPHGGPHVFIARRIGGPGLRPGMMGPPFMWHSRMGGPGHRKNVFYRAGGQVTGSSAAPMPLPSGMPDLAAMRAGATANARFEAARRLVLAIVMLLVSIFVFRRAFDWLNAKQAST